jgi:MSHA biogenesis protein MshK
MAGDLNMASRKFPVFFMCTMIAAMQSLYAEELPDPTRPPALLGSAQLAAPVTAGPVLQSVLISPQRRAAIISGQAVKAGGKYGEYFVFKITESEVVLRRGKEIQTLKLFPDFVKLTGVAQAKSAHRQQ